MRLDNDRRTRQLQPTAFDAEAVAEYEAALKMVGDNYPPLKEWLARAKDKVGIKRKPDGGECRI